MNIEIISSSPRKESLTHRVALHLQTLLASNVKQHNVGLIDVRDWNLGMLQNVFSSVDTTPTEYKPLSERMFAANAFIIVTPEYNGSYSSAFKNLFDHFPKQSRKAFGIVTASTGATGGVRASQQLLHYVPALFGIASPLMLIVPSVDKKFDIDGRLTDELFQKSIHQFTTEFLWLAERISV